MSDEISSLKIYVDKEMVNQHISEANTRFDTINNRINDIEDELSNGLVQCETTIRNLKDELLDRIETKENKEYTFTSIGFEDVTGICDVRCNALIKTKTGRLVGAFEGSEAYVAWYNGSEWVKSNCPEDSEFGSEIWNFAEKDGVIVCNSAMQASPSKTIYYSEDNGETFHQVDFTYYNYAKSVLVIHGMFVIPVHFPLSWFGTDSSNDKYKVKYVYSVDGKNWKLPSNVGETLLITAGPTSAYWRDDGFVTFPYEHGTDHLGRGHLINFFKYNYDFDPNCQDEESPAYNPFILTEGNGNTKVGLSPYSSFYEAAYCDDNVLIWGGANNVSVSIDRGKTYRSLGFFARSICKLEYGFLFGTTNGKLLFSSNLVDFQDISIPGVSGNTFYGFNVDGDEIIIFGKPMGGISIRTAKIILTNAVPKVLVSNSIGQFDNIPLDKTSSEFINWNPSTDDLKGLLVDLIKIAKGI